MLIIGMVQSKTPQQKKKDSYAHDQVEGGEYPHADRKNRPRAKAFGQREFRRISKQLLASQPEEVLQLPQDRTRRTWQKSGIDLPEHLQSTRIQRDQREAHNIVRRGYTPATHERFRRVLESWMKGRSEHSSSLAEYYSGVLTRFPDELQWKSTSQLLIARRAFLNRFFSKEPELKERFQNWIAAVTESEPI
jgi:hypothetical protein